MTNPEKLAQLTPHGVDPLKTYGGIPDVTAMDVAGELRRCTWLEAELLLVKYAGHERFKLWAAVLMHIMGLGWDLERGSFTKIADHVVAETIGSNRCPDCNGTQEATIAGKIELCPRCSGSGVEYYSIGHLQEYAEDALRWLRGVESSAWSKVE